jgi:sulfotransferase 6B1
MRNTAQRTIRGWDKLSEAGINDIKNISKGSFRKGHVPAHQDLINILKENEVKCIFVIRDPRDITVSNFRYITNIDSTHPAHHYFCNLRTDHERLKVSICGQKGIIDGIDKTLDLFSGFLYQKNVLTVKFEELIGPSSGGSEYFQKECLHRISDFVNVSIKKEEFVRIVNRIFNPKTLTFNKGKVGNWKDFYSPEHEKLIYERCENLIKEYGYEIRR